jgi:hypothetical protein
LTIKIGKKRELMNNEKETWQKREYRFIVVSSSAGSGTDFFHTKLNHKGEEHDFKSRDTQQS